MSEYELHEIFHQCIASKQSIPIFGGLGAIPKYPSFKKNSREKTRDDGCENDDDDHHHDDDDDIDEDDDFDPEETQRSKFAEYVLALFLPWPAKTFVYPDVLDNYVDRLNRMMLQLCEGSLFRQDDLSYRGPPGFEDAVIPACPYNADVNVKKMDPANAYAFVQKCTARFIANLGFGLRRLSNTSRQIQAIWRSRACQNWDDEDADRLLFPKAYVEANTFKGRGYGDHDITNAESEKSRRDVQALAIELLRMLAPGYVMDSNAKNSSSVYVQYLSDFELLLSPVVESNFGMDRQSIVRTYVSSNRIDVTRFPVPGTLIATVESIKNVLEALKQPVEIQPLPVIQPIVRLNTADYLMDGRCPAMTCLQQIKLRPILSRPNDGQCIVLKEIAIYFDAMYALQHYQVNAPLIMLHAEAGAGKSFIYECIEVLAEASKNTVCFTASTGVACSAIKTKNGARTIFSALGLGICKGTIVPLVRQNLINTKTAFGRPGLVIIDEAGFLKAKVILKTSVILKQLMENEIDFGGLSVLLSLDFFQLPPVKAKPLWKSAMFLSKEKEYKNDANMEVQYDREGTLLFLKFKYRGLEEQMRCKDPILYGFCKNLRKGITTGLKEYLREHRLTDADSKEFYAADIVSPGNEERRFMNRLKMIDYASEVNQYLITWRYPTEFHGYARPFIETMKDIGNQEGLDLIYTMNPLLIGMFCLGAPVIIGQQTNPVRGIANGVRAHMYGLEWATNDLRTQAQQYIADNSRDGKTVLLPIGLEPAYVLVRPQMHEGNKLRCSGACTLVENDIIIPIKLHRVQGTIQLNGKTALCMSEKPDLELGFVSTVYKAQGSTLERAILALLMRPKKPSREDFFALYTLLTRVVYGDHLRILCLIDDLLSYIDDLRPPDALLAFLDGYDTDGIWSREKASNSLLSRNLTSGKGTESTNVKTKKSKKAKVTPVKSTSKGIQQNQKSHSKYIHIKVSFPCFLYVNFSLCYVHYFVEKQVDSSSSSSSSRQRYQTRLPIFVKPW